MTLSEIVPWGRTLDEYSRMFALDETDLAKPILGVGDGPASFNAEINALGGQVVSIDPIYAFSAAEIEVRVEQTYPTIVDQVRQTAGRYRWEQFRDAEDLGRYRLVTMNRFLSDYELGRKTGRYVAGQLPTLSFPDQAFALSLCSHLLFLYSGHLSEQFHYASIKELLRVSADVRIFPLQTLNGQLSPYVTPVIEALTKESIRVERVPVTYEFQRGANEMLRIRY